MKGHKLIRQKKRDEKKYDQLEIVLQTELYMQRLSLDSELYLLYSLHDCFCSLLTFDELYLLFMHIRCNIRVVFCTNFNALNSQIVNHLESR